MSLEVIGYFAGWCPHCIDFKPYWDKLMEWAKSNDVVMKEYWDEKDKGEIERANITEFPTILLFINGTIKQDLPTDIERIANIVIEEYRKLTDEAKKTSRLHSYSGLYKNINGKKSITYCENGICETKNYDDGDDEMRNANSRYNVRNRQYIQGKRDRYDRHGTHYIYDTYDRQDRYDPRINYRLKYEKNKKKYLEMQRHK